MALPATDDFTTGTDQALTDYSSNWTQNNGAFQVLAASDDVQPNDTVDFLAHWSADTFNNDQYSEVVVKALGGSYIGPACRVHASAVTGYCIQWDDVAFSPPNKRIARLLSGSWDSLQSSENKYSVSDVIKIDASGTTITPYRNGTEDLDLGAQTDSNISSGYAGLTGYGTDSTTRLDDWEGGNLDTTLTISESDGLTLGESLGSVASLGDVEIASDNAAYQGTGVRII